MIPHMKAVLIVLELRLAASRVTKLRKGSRLGARRSASVGAVSCFCVTEAWSSEMVDRKSSHVSIRTSCARSGSLKFLRQTRRASRHLAEQYGGLSVQVSVA